MVFTKQTIAALTLATTTWLTTGLSVDDEFYNEYQIFLKHRPAFQYYFRSPLGMQDMPADYPTDLKEAYHTYQEFVLKDHWSSGFDGVAVCLVLVTICYTGYILIKYIKRILAKQRYKI